MVCFDSSQPPNKSFLCKKGLPREPFLVAVLAGICNTITVYQSTKIIIRCQYFLNISEIAPLCFTYSLVAAFPPGSFISFHFSYPAKPRATDLYDFPDIVSIILQIIHISLPHPLVFPASILCCPSTDLRPKHPPTFYLFTASLIT